MFIDMSIDHETCSKCGMCANICGTKAIDHFKDEIPSRSPERAETCILCGQCMAVCPTGSITISGLTYKDLFDLPQHTSDYPALFDLMSTRRSIRHFKDKSVPRELLEKIIDAAAQAPMGFPPHKTHITVVQDRSTIVKMLPMITNFYQDMVGWMKNPIIRFTIKRQTTPEDFATIKNHLIPLLLKRLPEIKKAGSDEITWGAPALMLFHADRLAESHTVDACIALTYAFLAAHALGLGVTVSGLLPPAITQTAELRDMLNIPKDHEVVCGMMLGYPRYRYQRAIKRPFASISWV
ncbi:MAG TPA: nitroreductase family protein [Syntrophomonadaceae bacterium]|nr:nitroreductase family protein [Syntrophomonadaceae bacterium]